MKSITISPTARWWLAAIVFIALAACGGSSSRNSGNNSSNSGSTANASTSVLPASQELTDTFAAILSGTQVTPVNQSTAQGAGTAVVNPATRTLVVAVATTGITATAADIREGPAGTNGAIVLPLTEAAPGSGIWGATATLTQAQLASLQAGNFYFNVSSAAFPGGELRGQLASAQSNGGAAAAAAAANNRFDVFASALRGVQEAPATPSAGQGAGAAIANVNTRSFIVTATTTGVAGTAANIHDGAPGANGAPVFALTQGVAGSGIWFARVTLNAAQLVLLEAGNFYLNVQSTAFPAGEIRGQLVPRQAGGTAAGIGAGATGASNIGAAIGANTTGIGTPAFGTSTGSTGTGVSGISGSGIATGTSNIGAGIGTNTTGIGTPAFGTATGLTGTGSAGTGISGLSGSGFGTSSTDLGTGTSTTGIGTPATGISSGSIGTGVSGLSGSGFGTGTTGLGTGTTGIATGTTGSTF